PAAEAPQLLPQYGLGAQVLSSLGLSKLILLTNTPVPQTTDLDAYGLQVTGIRPIDDVSTHRRDDQASR
ncbi:MAG: hypothetical protein AAFN17_17625, partial [Pseudomonadota bacterium]